MYTDKSKTSIYKWRENNKQAYNAYIAEQMKKQYEKKKEAIIKKNTERYFVNQEFKKFLKILI
jgi:hypothetical protein